MRYIGKIKQVASQKTRGVRAQGMAGACAAVGMNRHYARNHKLLLRSGVKKADVAVVVHLYYTESWELIQQHLQYLNARHNFDLFVTLPAKNSHFSKTILQLYPTAHIVEVPNRGRDVLPFLGVASAISAMGYEYLLKLHSKKSTHRTDGDVWFASLLDNLLPENPVLYDELDRVLKSPETGIVGPEGQYVPLTVNFEANGMHMTTVIKRLYGKQKSYDVLQLQRSEYGFFAGTMFWARLEAIRPLLDLRYRALRFEPEQGQIDATFAHALERLFCLVPEIAGKQMYEISPKAIRAIPYASTNVPEWSDVYVGPKAQ